MKENIEILFDQNHSLLLTVGSLKGQVRIQGKLIDNLHSQIQLSNKGIKLLEDSVVDRIRKQIKGG